MGYFERDDAGIQASRRRQNLQCGTLILHWMLFFAAACSLAAQPFWQDISSIWFVVILLHGLWFLYVSRRERRVRRRLGAHRVSIPIPDTDEIEKPKRKRNFVYAADGSLLEVVDQENQYLDLGDSVPPKRKRDKK